MSTGSSLGSTANYATNTVTTAIPRWYRECRYLAPTSEVIVMPINNTSAENFAAWMGRSLYKRLQESFGKLSVHRLRVTVSETSGQAGVYTYSDA